MNGSVKIFPTHTPTQTRMVQLSSADILVLKKILVSITIYILKYLDYKNLKRSNKVGILQDGNCRDKKQNKTFSCQKSLLKNLQVYEVRRSIGC